MSASHGFAGSPNGSPAADTDGCSKRCFGSSGFQAAYDVVEPSSGDSLSIGVFDDLESMRAAEQAVGDARPALGIAASPPDEVVVWDVVESAIG